MFPPLTLARTPHKEDTLTLTRRLWSQQVHSEKTKKSLSSPSAFVIRFHLTPTPLQTETMDTAAVVTLLALLVAMAGISQALLIQSGLDKNDVLPGSSEENMADHLLGLVRWKTTHKLLFSLLYCVASAHWLFCWREIHITLSPLMRVCFLHVSQLVNIILASENKSQILRRISGTRGYVTRSTVCRQDLIWTVSCATLDRIKKSLCTTRSRDNVFREVCHSQTFTYCVTQHVNGVSAVLSRERGWIIQPT